jgi:hypothetical protein
VETKGQTKTGTKVQQQGANVRGRGAIPRDEARAEGLGERCQQERAKTLDEIKREIVGRGAKGEGVNTNYQESIIK